MLALDCDVNAVFDSVCRAIAPHDPSGLGGPLVEHLLSPLVVFVAVLVGGRIVRHLITHNRVLSSDAQVRALLHNVITAATYVFSVLAGLVAAGLNISLLLTFGGLFSLAIGLAFQDVLRNLLAGMFLLVEKPFRLGDIVTVEGINGTVETIQLRTTALRTPDGRIAVLPNLLAFNNAVINHSANPNRRSNVTVRIPRERDLDEALRQARAVVLATKGVSKSPAPSLLPQVDQEAILVHCHFWVDHGKHDAEHVAAEIAERLVAVGQPSA